MRRRFLSVAFGSAVAAAGCSSTVSIERTGPTMAGAGGSATTTSSAMTTSSSMATSGAGGGSAVAKIALGGWHTCAIKEDGSLWCWGDNSHGQLGVGMTCSAPPNQLCGIASPVEVTALGHAVRDVALGWDGPTCAVKTDGSLWCWGDNSHGQLGDGTTESRSSPVKVAALGGSAVKVAIGSEHCCALRTDGSVWCWGRNDYGQLGDGTAGEKHSPAALTALGSDVVDLVGGGSDSCARKKDGSLWCWGNSVSAKLALGAACPGDACVKSPVEVTAFGKDLVELALGGTHGCARKKDGSLWCLGWNYWGQLGDGTVVDESSPVAVSDLAGGIVRMALGPYNTCAGKADGTLLCWGSNESEQLGTPVKINCHDNGLFAPCSTKPLAVAGIAGVVEVALGDGHACARSADGSLSCWGDNTAGELGDGSTADRATPTAVLNF